MAAGKKSNARELFDAYQVQEDAVTAAKDALERAVKARSDAVQAIEKNIGKGPFQWDGRTIKVFKRETKDENDVPTGVTYFFRSLGEEVQKID